MVGGIIHNSVKTRSFLGIKTMLGRFQSSTQNGSTGTGRVNDIIVQGKSGYLNILEMSNLCVQVRFKQ